ncbi:MAG: hypothetical protein ACXVIG_07040 [Halobacteriota archaeon]
MQEKFIVVIGFNQNLIYQSEGTPQELGRSPSLLVTNPGENNKTKDR